jgi:hypothetical protein
MFAVGSRALALFLTFPNTHNGAERPGGKLTATNDNDIVIDFCSPLTAEKKFSELKLFN